MQTRPAATWKPFRAEQVYAEAGGFVLLDPARLATLLPSAPGQDLLALFTEQAVGDEVARSGAVVPALGVDPGFYDLLVHADERGIPRGPDDPPAVDPRPRTVRRPADLASPGWVLVTVTGELFLDPLAALQEWDPEDARHCRVQVPPGAYAVEIRGHLPTPHEAGSTAGDGIDGTYSWVLRRTAEPCFTADVG